MIFTEQTATVYRCALCKRWWQTAVPAVSCCVAHSAGSCCHYGETETTKPKKGRSHE